MKSTHLFISKGCFITMLERLPLRTRGYTLGERERDGRLQLFEKTRKYLKEKRDGCFGCLGKERNLWKGWEEASAARGREEKPGREWERWRTFFGLKNGLGKLIQLKAQPLGGRSSKISDP